MSCLDCLVEGGGNRAVVHVGPCCAGEGGDILLFFVCEAEEADHAFSGFASYFGDDGGLFGLWVMY